jgi:hypothetical protein
MGNGNRARDDREREAPRFKRFVRRAFERCRMAALERTHDLYLVDADVPGIGASPIKAVVAEDKLPFGAGLIRSLRRAEGLNTITGRGEIGASLPVFGLRPMRWPFLRTTNEPRLRAVQLPLQAAR